MVVIGMVVIVMMLIGMVVDRDGCDCDDYGIFNFVNGFVGGNF